MEIGIYRANILDSKETALLTNGELESILDSEGSLVHSPTNVDIVNDLMTLLMKRIETYKYFLNSKVFNLQENPLRIVFTWDTRINAWCYSGENSQSKKFDFVAINLGTIFTFLANWYRLLSNPLNFPEIGNPSKESAERSIIQRLDIDFVRDNYNFCIPNCPIRQKYAIEMSIASVEFFVCHEITHIRNGHLEFLRKSIGANHIPEDRGICINKIDLLTRRTLEWDADCGAINCLFGYMANWNIENRHMFVIHNSDEVLIHSELYGSVEKIVQTVLNASYMALRIFDETWDIVLQSSRKHPLIPYRLLTVYLSLHQRCIDDPNFGISLKRFQTITSSNLIRLENALKRVEAFYVPPIDFYRFYFTNESNSAILKEYIEHWGKLRPILYPHRRGIYLPS